MSKVNAIRKKALEFVRKQNWDNAIKEYKRLSELDQSNPNVFNELGDIYLKLGNKTDAYASFTRAIDAYTRVSLYNNAVAVCKKVIRLIPSRTEILTKLGYIRKKQGLNKEADSYYLSFLEGVLSDTQIGPEEVGKHCAEIVPEMNGSAVVLEKVYECMNKFRVKDGMDRVLRSLAGIYEGQKKEESLAETHRRMKEHGVELSVGKAAPAEKEGVVITEENIWSAEAHSDGERIEIKGGSERPAEQEAPKAGASQAETFSEQPPTGRSVYEYGEIQLGAQGQAAQTGASTQTISPPDESVSPSKDEETTPTTRAEATEPEPGTDTDDSGPTSADAEQVSPPPSGDEAQPEDFEDTDAEADDDGDPSSAVHVSAIIDELNTEGRESISEDDYRSHYDLGMAYLEMDLLSEAIREYQFASKSPQYQTRSLEMIGLCFLKQNKAQLAIKQLTRGLALIGPADREALGIKYNLGLAYEMVGEIEKARSAFEDVYVDDVTFRDVAEKLAKLS